MKMELQIAICDDEKIWADELAHQIREYGREHDIIFYINEFSRTIVDPKTRKAEIKYTAKNGSVGTTITTSTAG